MNAKCRTPHLVIAPSDCHSCIEPCDLLLSGLYGRLTIFMAHLKLARSCATNRNAASNLRPQQVMGAQPANLDYEQLPFTCSSQTDHPQPQQNAVIRASDVRTNFGNPVTNLASCGPARRPARPGSPGQYVGPRRSTSTQPPTSGDHSTHGAQPALVRADGGLIHASSRLAGPFRQVPDDIAALSAPGLSAPQLVSRHQAQPPLAAASLRPAPPPGTRRSGAAADRGAATADDRFPRPEGMPRRACALRNSRAASAPRCAARHTSCRHAECPASGSSACRAGCPG